MAASSAHNSAILVHDLGRAIRFLILPSLLTESTAKYLNTNGGQMTQWGTWLQLVPNTRYTLS